MSARTSPHDADLQTSRQLCADIASILAGHPPQVQGATLADLLAMWLAGFLTDDATRDELLTAHIELVRKLIPINAEQIRKSML